MRIKRFIIFAILIVIVIPSTIALPSIIKEEINEQEPLWGVAYLDVRVKEEYGNPENPQYRYPTDRYHHFSQGLARSRPVH